MTQTVPRLNKKTKIGMLFPGQGSQFLGMGKEFYDNERIVQEYFEDASKTIEQNLIKICFASSDEILQGTLITQAAIFLVSVSIFSVLQDNFGIAPDLVAGHSLGEYSAAFAAQGINFFDAMYLLKKRADSVIATSYDQGGAMLAVMDMTKERLQEICNLHDDPSGNLSVAEMAVFNSPTQIVVSGTQNALKNLAADVAVMRGKSVFLACNVAYHSRLMRNAENLYMPYLIKADFANLNVPLINNIMAQKITSADSLKLSLVKQTSSHIYWWDSMQYFQDMDIIVQVGPSDKIAKILQRQWPEKKIIAINTYQDIDTLVSMIKELED